MKSIVNLIAVMVTVSGPALAAETNRTIETEPRDSAIVGNRLTCNCDFTRYIPRHQIYVCKVIQPPEPTDNRNRWQLQIDRTIRGQRTGEIRCPLPGVTNEVKSGTNLIVLGNDATTGFNVIEWWVHSEKTEKAIVELTQPSAPPLPRAPQMGHSDGER